MRLRLAVFDLDGTLKEARDPYVYLHRRLGTLDASQPFFSRAKAGELDYDEWLRLDVALWQGVSRVEMEDHMRANPYLPGAQETIRALKHSGVWLAIISSGIDVHAQQVQRELGLDRIYANQILFENGRATGEARTCIREGGKGEIVAELQAELGVEPQDCLAVGDGSSDVDMFSRVRVGVAVNPSCEEVRAAAHLVLEEPDLRPLLPRLGEQWPGWLPR